MGKGLRWTHEEESILTSHFNRDIKIVDSVKSIMKLNLLPNRTQRAIEDKIYDLDLHVNPTYFKKYAKDFKAKHNLKTNTDLSIFLLNHDKKCPASQSTLSVLLSNKRKSDKTVKDGTLKRLISIMRNIDNGSYNKQVSKEVKQTIAPTVIKRGRKPKNDKSQIKLDFNGVIDFKNEEIKNDVINIEPINFEDKSIEYSIQNELEDLRSLVDALDSECAVLRSDLIETKAKYLQSKMELANHINKQTVIEANIDKIDKDGVKGLNREINRLKDVIIEKDKSLKSKDLFIYELSKENKELKNKMLELDIENKELKSTVDQLNFKTKNIKPKKVKDESFVNDGLIKEKPETNETKEKEETSFWSFLKF